MPVVYTEKNPYKYLPLFPFLYQIYFPSKFGHNRYAKLWKKLLKM